MTSEKWFCYNQQHIESEYNNSLAGNTTSHSQSLHIFIFGVENITIHNSNATEAHKYIRLSSFWFLKNDFASTNNILKVNQRILWLETPSNHHQSLYILIFGVENVEPATILMQLKLISKWVRGLFDFWKLMFHQATTY